MPDKTIFLNLDFPEKGMVQMEEKVIIKQRTGDAGKKPHKNKKNNGTKIAV